MNQIERGSIYGFNAGGEQGREIYGDRPVIVVSSKEIMQRYGIATIVPLSTTLRDGESHVIIKSSKYQSIAMCEHIRTVDVTRLLDKYGSVTDIELQKVEEAIAYSTGIVRLEEREEASSDKGLILQMQIELQTYKQMYNGLLDRLSEKQL